MSVSWNCLAMKKKKYESRSYFLNLPMQSSAPKQIWRAVPKQQGLYHPIALIASAKTLRNDLIFSFILYFILS